MQLGDVNDHSQELVRKTDLKSTTHKFAKIWVMRCHECESEYGCNSCDAHIRKCPLCDNTSAIGEPLE